MCARKMTESTSRTASMPRLLRCIGPCGPEHPSCLRDACPQRHSCHSRPRTFHSHFAPKPNAGSLCGGTDNAVRRSQSIRRAQHQTTGTLYIRLPEPNGGNYARVSRVGAAISAQGNASLPEQGHWPHYQLDTPPIRRPRAVHPAKEDSAPRKRAQYGSTAGKKVRDRHMSTDATRNMSA